MVKRGVSPVASQLWGLGIALGVIAILFGVLALFWPGLTVALFIVLFGVFVLVWGVVGLIVSISSISTNKFWWLELLFSVLAVGLAVYLLRNPESAATLFILLIGLTFLVRGVIDVLEGLFGGADESGQRAFNIVLGALGIIAGIITLVHPVSAGLLVVWIVGLYAVLYGSLVIAFAFRAKAALER